MMRFYRGDRFPKSARKRLRVELSIEEYARLADYSIDDALMEADKAVAQSPVRLSSEEVLSGIRRRIDEYRK